MYNNVQINIIKKINRKKQLPIGITLNFTAKRIKVKLVIKFRKVSDVLKQIIFFYFILFFFFIWEQNYKHINKECTKVTA